jgi:hypothetical protein
VWFGGVLPRCADQLADCPLAAGAGLLVGV